MEDRQHVTGGNTNSDMFERTVHQIGWEFSLSIALTFSLAPCEICRDRYIIQGQNVRSDVRSAIRDMLKNQSTSRISVLMNNVENMC
jgi:hypothetical protein